MQLSLMLFEVARFSREAAAARSCGRKPAESEPKKSSVPRSGDSNWSRGNLCRRFAAQIPILPCSRVLTPTARCCHRFAIPEMRNFKTYASGSDSLSRSSGRFKLAHSFSLRSGKRGEQCHRDLRNQWEFARAARMSLAEIRGADHHEGITIRQLKRFFA
jgi:hypothetical protein